MRLIAMVFLVLAMSLGATSTHADPRLTDEDIICQVECTWDPVTEETTCRTYGECLPTCHTGDCCPGLE